MKQTTTTAAAIILCAGKGTRMNDGSINKVSFECAGLPVVTRIVKTMRKGGVSRFVIVVGHQPQSVMEALKGEKGVIYAYQSEQKGTGHAALCGMRALSEMGYSGPVIVSMGDKVVAETVVKSMLEQAFDDKTVFGVQPVSFNPQGGRVILSRGQACGIVEYADAALMSLAGVDPSQYAEKLKSLGLNEKKAAKVIKAARHCAPKPEVTLAGVTFSAEQILSTPYANAGLYCFDLDKTMVALESIGSDNAQGEVYLTDTLEYFASRKEATLIPISDPADLLTFSTKPELREMSRHFMRPASQFIVDIAAGRLDKEFSAIYPSGLEEQKSRYIDLLKSFIDKFGDQKVIISRAPGRVNLMGRHIDHRGGGSNVMAIDRDSIFVVAPRQDDIVRYANVNPQYKEGEFSICATLGMAPHETWLGYLESEAVVEDLKKNQGDWSNYIKSAVLRFQLESDIDLCGMNIMATGNIPVAAGLSSSSSIVVAVAEAVTELNCLNITTQHFIELCGEGEWFVGSRGGAGDHAAMKVSKLGEITHLDFKPFKVGSSFPFAEQFSVIVADSCTKAKKSEGARDKFNSKVASYEFAFMLLKRSYPELGLVEFRDLAKVRPYSKIYEMLLSIPESMTREEISKTLPEYANSISRIFSNHADPGNYYLRNVALFGISECARSEKAMEYLKDGEFEKLGDFMNISHNGDRLMGFNCNDALLKELAAENAPVYLQSGAYDCSTTTIDGLCDILNSVPGVIGSAISGAGLGGCVIALVKKDKAETAIDKLDKEYYDKNGFPHSAKIYLPSSGSTIIV